MQAARSTMTHWGAFRVVADANGVVDVTGFDGDDDPSPIGDRLRGANARRVPAPLVRESWLADGVFANPHRRGLDPLVPVEWDHAINLAADAIAATITEHGNHAVYAGSYGWASAGRFHHAQSQLKRFLNLVGGFTGSIGTYSSGALEVVLPEVLGTDEITFFGSGVPSLDEVARMTSLFVSFGGFPASNTQVSPGGEARHLYRPHMRAAAARGCEFVSVGPVIGEFDSELAADWLPIRPGTDAAAMLGLAGELAQRLTPGELAGNHILITHCTGGQQLLDLLAGRIDGTRRDAVWAADICDVPVDRLRALAQRIVEAERPIVNATWSTQRIEGGEQAVWSLVALAAMTGKLGTAGAGLAFGYGSMGNVGAPTAATRLPAFDQGCNKVDDAIPVATLVEALERPGGEYLFAGQRRRFPKIDLIYWCGGNPYHHHQDLGRLERAWRIPRSVIVNDPYLTATAQRADIVFPASIGLERRDIAALSSSRYLVFMDRVLDRHEHSRDDFEIFSDLAERFGCRDRFTEGRTADEWVEHLYAAAKWADTKLPDFADFVVAGEAERAVDPPVNFIQQFRDESHRHPLATESGLVELWKQNPPPGVPEHPDWKPPHEWLGAAAADEFHLVSPQPRGTLHSQLAGTDSTSPAPVVISIDDAMDRGLLDGQIVLLRNERGGCLATVSTSDSIRPGVLELHTGVWWEPTRTRLGMVCANGNPNALTNARTTSQWASATAAHSCLVRLVAPVPADILAACEESRRRHDEVRSADGPRDASAPQPAIVPK